jgi:triosephosphate isomerase (TIM)
MKNISYVVGNWKMNLFAESAVSLAREVFNKSAGLKNSKAWISPAYIHLPLVTSFKGQNFLVGAQNSHWEDSGAYTGEVSPQMLKDVGVGFVILGHSERRQLFAESDESIKLKIRKNLSSGLKVILCVGETLEQREASQTEAVIAKQLKAVLTNDVNSFVAEDNLIIAYEPVWAIGTGKVAKPDEISSVHKFIADFLNELKIEKQLPILYGGSVKADNFVDIIKLNHVHGALVGGASLQAESFLSLIDIAERS